MDLIELDNTARALVAPGKGILAIDESLATIGKRFAAIGVACTEDERRAYRELLITAPGLGEWISAMILFDETLRQATAAAVPFTEKLVEGGMIPGIKVDTGARDLAGHAGEKVTEGLDGLRERLAEYRALGARFAKWRAVITLGPGLPSGACIAANAHALARYAALCQEQGLVPIVEPEVLMDWDNDIDRCYEVSEATLRAVFAELYTQGVRLEALVLKTNMVVSGKQCPQQAGAEEVAAKTLRCLRRAVPAAVAGIVFLSGGQGAEQATVNLNAMNAAATPGERPWPLSFSFGRALQEPALRIWAGQPASVARAQRALAHRSRCNALATRGQYTPALEAELAA